MPGAYAPEDEDDYFGAGNPGAGIENAGTTVATGTDQDMDGIMPFDLGGASARAASQRAALDKAMRAYMWSDLAKSAPDANDLTPDYVLEGNGDEYGDLLGGPSELQAEMGPGHQASLQALQNIIESGGYTRADQDWTTAQRAQQAQALRGQNEAALQQMSARGMGGSGAELAMRLAGNQSMNSANSMADAQAQQMALQRMMQATGQQQGFDAMELQRRNALDAFNQQNMGWRRDREQRNTGIANRQADAGVTGRQQAYQNQERAVAGYDQQYGTDLQNRNAIADRSQENTEAQADIVAGIATAICCHPDTPIATPDGDKRIADLREGDLVLTVHQGRVEARAIRAAQSVPVRDHIVQRVRLGNGVTLSITPNHPTSEGYGIGDLRAGDYIGGVRIVATEPIPYNAKATYDILPDSDTATYFAGGAHLGSTMRRPT